jgi:anaerobic ribonucleoside-triphosphate reductase activating protein
MTDPAAAQPTLRIASTIPYTEAEGPGGRFAIWTQGCAFRCPGCCNPHLWSGAGGQEQTPDALWEQIAAARERRPELEGITLVGGEPFQQDAALAVVARRVRQAGLSVMAFSGWTIEELRARGSALLEESDLLVDGLYVEALRTTGRRWIGSTNQGLHFLSDFYDPADGRFAEPNTAEVRMNAEGEIQLVGFPFDEVREAFGVPWQRATPAGDETGDAA